MKKKTKLISGIIFTIILVAACTYFYHLKPAEDKTDSSKNSKAKAPKVTVKQENNNIDKKDKVKDTPKKQPPAKKPESPARVIAIDAGHQQQGDSSQEPIGPGAKTTKPKVASGTSGRTSGLAEYELTLQVALKLQKELESRGYKVVMIRTTNDVNISNADRAKAAAKGGAEVFIRLHANGAENTSVNGALSMAPSKSNPYVASLAAESNRLAFCILNQYCTQTGLKSQGVVETDKMSGINWCTMPVTILEMGYMTNPEDDRKMADPDFQNKMVKGIADGLDVYFK